MNMIDSDWGRGQILWPDQITILYIRAYILYSLCIYCIISCSFSMHLHLFKMIYIYIHEKYFKGLVIILITWCPRALTQSLLWIIRPCLEGIGGLRITPVAYQNFGINYISGWESYLMRTQKGWQAFQQKWNYVSVSKKKLFFCVNLPLHLCI